MTLPVSLYSASSRPVVINLSLTYKTKWRASIINSDTKAYDCAGHAPFCFACQTRSSGVSLRLSESASEPLRRV